MILNQSGDCTNISDSLLSCLWTLGQRRLCPWLHWPNFADSML
jgi:hypothetical protein